MVTLDAAPTEEWAVKTYGFRTPGRPGHNGVDMGTPDHSRWQIHGARVFAPFDGLVNSGSEANGAGNWVWVTRADGLVFKCFHLSGYKVRSGFVRAGEVVGYVGNTGASQGAHYHIELWSSLSGAPFDPWPAIEASLTTPAPPAPNVPQEDDMPLTDEEKDDIAGRAAQKVMEVMTGRAQAQKMSWAFDNAGNPYPATANMVSKTQLNVAGLATQLNVPVEWAEGVPTVPILAP